MIAVSNQQHWLKDIVDLSPDKIFIITDGTEKTFRTFHQEVLLIAHHLKNQGVSKGQLAGILIDHNYKFFSLVNALWLLGAIPVPLNTRSTSEELEILLNDHSIKYLVHKNDQSKISSTNNILIEDLIIENSNLELLETQVDFNPSNSALLMFTSGSTGKVKGVVHTFGSLFESVNAFDQTFKLSKNDLWLASLPQYHIGGFMIFIRALLSGSSIVFPQSLKYDDLKYEIIKSNPTHFSTVSTTLKRLLEDGIEPPLNHKHLLLGGGYLDPKLCVDAVNKGWKVVKVYGSTETCSMVTALSPNELKEKPNSAGKPLGKNQIKIIRHAAEPHNDNINYGEIAVKSDSLFKEYLNDPNLTSSKFEDGFYLTGDYGWFDEENYLFIDVRREDIIVTGGENVSALEVERTILSTKYFTDAVVFGVPDEKWGQIVCAAIVKNFPDEIKLKELLKNRLASYKIPKKIYFVDSIPRNDMGKIDRKKLFSSLNLKIS